MQFLKTFAVLSFFVFGAIVYSWAEYDDVDISAQDARVLDDPQWQATIDKIAEQTKALLTENEKLNSEYEFLQGKIKELKSQTAKTKDEISALKAGRLDKKAFASDEDQNTDVLAQMEKLQKEIDGIGLENKDLENQLAEIAEKNRLWRIKVSTLENQRRDANLDVNYKKANGGVGDVVAHDDLADLQAQLEKSLQNEKELNASIEKINEQKQSLPEEITVLKKKNRDLEDHLKILKQQIAEQQKQNEKVKNSVKKGKGKPQGAAAELVKQKKSLEAQVSKLSAQLDAVSKTVGESQEVLEKKRQLMDQIMHLDAENQELRAKIDGLTSSSSE